MAMIDELRKYTDPGLLRESGLPPVLWGLKVLESEASYDASPDGDPRHSSRSQHLLES